MAWEIKGTTGSLDTLHIDFQSQVKAPKNPKLIREIKKSRKITPSEFLKEMSMDTRQKLANTHEMHLPKIVELLDMGETSLQKNTQLVVDEPMFQPYPSEIFFQKFEPFTTYEVPLLLRNNDKVPRLVKVTQVDTPYFKIITSADAHQKVGPGLPVIYKIQFLPEENKDYNHELIITTEREKFIIPIRCIGSRAILDFPDEINFSLNPVRHLNSKVLLIRNIGNKDAKFSLKVDSPFSVSPDHGILPIGENMQVTLDFQPKKCGEYKKDLMISYDSGEIIYVNLYGAAQDVNVRLEKNSIRIEDTYITMNNQRTVTINNRSDIIVHYEWKKYATSEEEEQQKLKEIANLSRDEEIAKHKLSNQSADYVALLSRNFQNKIKTTQNKSYQFDDEVFFLQPIEGDIWPNSSIDISVIFKPDYAQTYNKVAFCEITGRESRLPLRLCGIGSGPKVQLSIENLDVGSIFIGSTHVYEVVMANKGFIDAIYSVAIPNTQFGKCFTFEPNEGLISPGGFQPISIVFSSSKLGEFDEAFEFTIDGKPEKYQLIIRGTVIPPTFQFNLPKIKFGLVSYGFKYTQTCFLTNTSLVPMTFNLRVASDSEARDSIIPTGRTTGEPNLDDADDYNFKEFSLTPSIGIIPPQSEVKVLVEFVPHFIKKYETSLIVDIEDVGMELLNLPISARSIVPNITLQTTEVDMGRCFIYYPYERMIKLSNETPLKARYYILPSKSQDSFKFTSNQAEGIIEPNSVKEISVFSEALQLNDIEGDLLIKINGSVDTPLKCHYVCLSQGPVVQIHPKEIDWGLTTVLQKSSREILLSNESLIEAKFSTSMSKRNSAWRLDPAEGVVEPGTEISIQAICYLTDKLKYDDCINIDILHSHTQKINVRATGGGSSIVSVPNIGNLVDFGTYFSGGTVKRVFVLTNKSSRPQNLSFQPEGRQSINLINKKQLVKEKAKLNPPPTVFTVDPNRLELNPGESKEILIQGYGEKPQYVEETITCQAIIGKLSGKDRIMKFKVKCEFISPLISFSTRDIIFRCEHDGNKFPTSQTKSLTISNISSLDLTAQLNTKSPFSLIDDRTGKLVNELLVNLKTGESLYISCVFDTTFKKDSFNETVHGSLTICYSEHEHNDVINLKGEIFFPNIYLEKTNINFGCILNNTEVNQKIKMTNLSPLIVEYKWKFIVEKDSIVSNLIVPGTSRSTNFDSRRSTDIEPQQAKEIEYDQLKEMTSSLANQEEIKVINEQVNVSNSENTVEQDKNPNEMQMIDLENSLVKKSFKLEELLTKQNELELPSIEEIFDISPLYGNLHPGETQNLTITYYGHKEIKAQVKAICEIKNGPDYEMHLKGEASVLNYELSEKSIDLGYVPFDEVCEAFISVRNLGKVTIEFGMVGPDIGDETDANIEPDKPVIRPMKGYIEADKIETITIRYLPGIPKKFTKNLKLQISHFAPEDIVIKGEAGFADIMLDLPRFENDIYKALRREARIKLKAKDEAKNIPIESDKDIETNLTMAPELNLQIEIDRLAIQTFIKKMMPKITAESLAEIDQIKLDILTPSTQSLKESNKMIEISDVMNGLDKRNLNKSMELSSDMKRESSTLSRKSITNEMGTGTGDNFTAPSTPKTHDSSRSSIKNKKLKPYLPDYILDFGHVILGTVKTHVIRAANMGKILASFEIERQNFSKTGFLVDLEKVKNLPNEESVEFVVTFDPRGANLGLGPVEHLVPLNIYNGPIVNLRLKANVTMPDLQISNDIVEFAETKCGECKIITVQLHNHKEVRCDWSASYLPSKDEKFTPMHLKRKKKIEGETNKPRTFEIIPPSGILMPSQKVNIQLKFMPTEEKLHEERVTIRMAQSSQRLMILCKGRGLEPRIELTKNSLEFDPILPHSVGDEQEIKIVNPCPFPIEIYNLEFDKNYLEEEKILRIIRGYDEYNTILLPPRNPNEKLPLELYEYFEDQLKKLEEEEKKQKQILNDTVNQTQLTENGTIESARQPIASAGTDKTKSKSDTDPGNPKRDSAINLSVGDVDKNPVFDSIARYLGIDLSAEGKAARNRRGVAMIIHGPPLSGKSRAAVCLAKHYECALLTIDSIVIEAIASSTSASAAKARQLCAETAAKHAEEARALEAAEQARLQMAGVQSTVNGQPGLSVEALAQHSQSQGGLQGGSKKTSVAGDSHTNVKIPKKGAKGEAVNVDQSSTHPSTPPPLLAPIARKLSISTNLFSQEDGYMSTVLPEDVIVELLAERFQLSDCNRGIIIDGLDTLFAQNYLLAATAILKAFNNRRYIYCVTMKSDFQKYKEQLNKIAEEKLKAKREKEIQEQNLIEEMDEETYNKLPAERRKEIDDRLLEAKKLRLKREAEEKAAEKERIEKEKMEEMARLEEEKKKKKKAGGKEPEKKGTIAPITSKPTGKEPVKETLKGKESNLLASHTTIPANTDRPHTQLGSEDAEKTKKAAKTQHVEEEPQPQQVIKEKVIDPEEEKRKEAEKLLQQRFKTFDLYFKDLSNLLDAWDRTQGNIFRQPSPSEKSDHDEHLTSKKKKDTKGKQSKVEKEKVDKEKEKAEAEKAKAEQQQQQQQQAQGENENADGNENENILPTEKKEADDGIGVPHIIVENINKSDIDELHKHPKFPPISEVLDGMGLGPKGPPIPPPAIFAVVPYPIHRKAPPGSEFSHYVFVTINENDPNLISDEKPKEVAVNPDAVGIDGEKTPDINAAKNASQTKKTAKGGTARGESRTEVPRRTSGDKKRTESRGKRESGTQSPNRGSSSMSGNKGEDDVAASIDGSSLDKPSQKLQRFRWIIPQKSEISIRLRFTSEEIGQFDQTLNFEIVGTRRRYQLHCRGICTFPTITREPRIVFPNRKKTKEQNEIVHKKYLLADEIFEFGPLLVGNNKERCKEGKFPEYEETLSIQNVSPIDAEVNFCFLEENVEKNDICFYLEPSELMLKPNETKSLKIYAIPKESKLYADTLICCIKENPEPITFRISCIGQKPELALDKKEFNFKQVLLHRKDSKDIKMTNNQLIPIQWKLEGVDLLGDEFVCNQTTGVIEPLNSFNLILHFRALKPLVITAKDKKILKLLVSSVNGFLGFMENHTIAVTAEAYDVALEINLPKGNDGGLDFGSIRVGFENKLNCTLKNKGKYPIRYNFLTEAVGPDTVEVLKYLTVLPASGELPSAHDRNSQNQAVQVVINPKKEIFIKDVPLLKCQITEPSVSEGTIIANIPIKISVKALLSKFNIVPTSEINFGPMHVNSKRQEKIIIENKGEFDFKFTIAKYDHSKAKDSNENAHDLISSRVSINKSQGPGRQSSMSQSKIGDKNSRRNSFRDGGNQNQGRVQTGIYTIAPAMGIILSNGFQVITIDCAPEAPGKYEEDLVIDITDRNMAEYPNGVMYKLSAEATYPSISNSIEMFEEHTIVSNITALDPKIMGVGIYVEDENKFFFNNVIVGRTAKAKFKLMNNNKIPVDLMIALKASNKTTRGVTDSTFVVEPERLQIAPYSFAYATVSFTPSAMAPYSSYFEASLENMPNALKQKSELKFEIYGDGNLPRFNIIKPTLRNKKGQTLLLFKRCVLNHIDTQQLVLSNEGSLPAKVNFFMYDPDSAFKFRPTVNAKQALHSGLVIKENDETVSSVIIQPNTQISFTVTCSPRNVQTYQASLQLTVTDNQFEDTLIQLIGEGYMEDVVFENLHSLTNQNELDDDVLPDEEVAALKCNSMNFGDVYVNEKKQILFTMKNQSKSDCYRFEWPSSIVPMADPNATQSSTNAPASSQTINPLSENVVNQNTTGNPSVSFSPRVGHLHAGCTKDITVTFKSMEPKFLQKKLFSCFLSKIIFEQSINEVKDWDDRMTVVKWINEVVQNSNGFSSSLNDQTLTIQRQVSELGNLPGTVVPPPQNQNTSTQSEYNNRTSKQIIRKKVIEVEQEPRHIKTDEVVQPMDLFMSVNCDYCRFRCKTNVIRFKDTLMFQTRVFEVSMINRGKISFDFNWKTIMEDSRRPFTPLIQPDTLTPEQSLSPRGRQSKNSKNTDSSMSPTRRTTNGTKEPATKDAKKEPTKGGAGAKKVADKEKVEDKGKSAKKLGKDASKSQSSDDKDRDILDATSKLNQNDSAEMTSRDDNTGLHTGRPESQAQMRAESSLSQHSPSTISETGYVPFNVEPVFGKIEPGKTQIFKVKFSPLNISDYHARLLCQIPNTEDGKAGPMIAVKGRGLLPYCHFELEESDYITSGRRNPELPGPSGAASGLGLDQMTKVIEFNCVGLASKCVKKFEIINPTNVDYDFEWQKEEQNDAKRHDQFICMPHRGNLMSGRKFEITFEFYPSEIGVQENFWRFTIGKYNLSVPFLLVGHASEPKVIFDRSHISFKPLLIGRLGYETIYLINQENKEIGYSFDQTSCYTEGRSAVILVDPAMGVLGPNSKLPIKLSYQPKEQRQNIFNLKCKLDNSNKPINLNVKGEGFSILSSLFCEDTSTGNKIEFSDTSINEIHMGEVEKNEVCFRNLFISNNGKHTANFEWFLTSEFEESLMCFSIEPKLGDIEPGDKKHCILKYTAKLEKSTIANLILKIENGSTYHVHLDGIAIRPDLQFSFSHYDFGPTFIYKAGMKLKTTQFTLTNRGAKDLNIACLSELNNSPYQFDFKQIILGPGKTTSSLITFIPRECKVYHEKLIFELNGLTKREVNLVGSGTQMRVELVDPRQKLFDIGTLQIGKISRKTLQIVNHSAAQIDFNLLFEPKSEHLNKDKSPLQIQPTQNISLKQGQICDLQFKFTPKTRIPKFMEEVNIEYNGINIPLFTLQGACHGYSIWLESNSLPFGAIAQKCSTIKRIVMHNDGDIGASFKWDIEKMKPEFSIFPIMGYISPGMEVNFDLVFNPTELSSDLRKENVKCFVEGIDPLLLTLSGSCVQIIPQKDVNYFETNVRQKDTKQITLTNKTNTSWELKPIIEGEYFMGLESFIVEAQKSSSYEITYFPLVMAVGEKRHNGSVFFSLPDGTGLLYNLVGAANPPKAVGKLQKEVPCKTQYVEVLTIENWLKKPQRFKVTFDITKPDKQDSSTVIKGHDYIDVPGNGKKEYKMNFYAHKEGTTVLKVVFKNEQTGEYCFYDIMFKAIKGSSVGTIDLVTQVRVPISYSLKLDNPLPNTISFNATCSNLSEILMPPSFSITGKGQGDFNFEYLPLKPGEMTSKLELNSPDLGVNIYDLNLKAIPAASERPIHFKTSLGNSHVLNAKFINFCRVKTDYICKVDNPDFKVDKSIAAAPSQTPSGIEVSFEISYEPSNLVDTKATLTLSSSLGGDYVFPLFGSCLPPKPQGPFVVKEKSNTSISFKNVFASPLTFSFAIDNPAFHVSKSTEIIKPHQTHKIVVGFDGTDGPNKADVMAKLVVTAPKSAGITNNIQWIYYLKGTS